MNDRDFSQLRENVETLTRRLDEQAALVRKTQASVSSLAESVAAVVSRERTADRRLHLNSFVAYLLFTVLLGGGFFALYNARTGDMVQQRDDAVAERDSARSQVSTLSGELAARQASEKKAYDYYLLLRDDQGAEAVARHADIEKETLTPTERELFAQGVEKARGQIVDAGYLSGIDAFRQNNFERAVTELRRGLAYQGEGARAAQMRYYLGVSLYKQGEHEEAARQIELAMAGGVEDAGMVDARFYLASAFEELGRYAEARAEYGKFATAQPRDPLAIAARRKAAGLTRVAVPKN